MNAVIQNMIERRSIRRFTEEQIPEETLNEILTAGLWAPCAGGRQAVKIVVMQSNTSNASLGRINRNLFGAARSAPKPGQEQISIAEDSSIPNAFYDAPTVLALFTPNNYPNSIQDCVVTAENIMLAAWSLGIGSVYIARGEKTFESEEGQALMKKWGLGEEYQCHSLIPLGFPKGNLGKGAPRKVDRIIFDK